MKITIRVLLRKNIERYEQLALENDIYTDDQLIDFMLQYPILINRPIDIALIGTKLCRPSEVLLEILPHPQQREFIKKDGELIVDIQVVRVK
ncbi:hypothetical protein HBA45_13010 [Providencia sp. 504mA]|nr:hypothetical protein [Providencia rettgeri]NIL72310.1 hypothetical protein [Providencia sp. 504mA]ELR5228236.1 hypothetical protein [Providencia rettgeri]NIA45103.1 hypothetical protein [Providencia rettgeri]NIA98577.1 hypothetical protein [Providencia rettgeri]